MPKQYQTEKEGQIEFFNTLKINADVTFIDNTDSIYKGNLFEFKLNIPNINTTLFQAIKYLSGMRIKGIGIPKNILLVSLNNEVAYLFNSADFIDKIENVYVGAASKNNEKFDTQIKPQKIDYSTLKGLQNLTEILDTDNFTKINIDVFCVVGWAERYYREVLNSTKIQMFKELQQPKFFEKYINAWNGKEDDFKYIMDCLNDKMHKKELGAFYTPAPYCKKATELVRKAIAQIPKGNDYIILDRCAGTGNLQEFLTDKNVADITIDELDKYLTRDIIEKYKQNKKEIFGLLKYKDFNKIKVGELEEHTTSMSIYDYLFDNELSHCIVNTYELKEWIVLNKLIGDKVRIIIPPPADVSNFDSTVKGADALSENFIYGNRSSVFDMSNEYYDSIEQLNNYVNDQKTNIIVFENPPYRNETSTYRDTGTRKNKDDSFVLKEYKNNKINKISRDYDLSILFIWSAKEYYLKKENDALIVFSPVKYFKSVGLDKGLTFIEGALLNRKYFHASPAAISLMYWLNKSTPNKEIKNFKLDTWDIGQQKIIIYDEEKVISLKNIEIKKCYTYTSTMWYENNTNGKDIAYLDIKGFSISHLAVALTNIKDISPHKRGFYLKDTGYYEKLPLFCAKLYPQKNWYEKDVYFSTADGGDRYTKDADFLKSCFIFTCLSQQNHCLSFFGSNNQFYKNELCFDKNTIASEKLKEFILTEAEQSLINNFNEILELARETKNYNADYTYSTYQIDKELNTKEKDEVGFVECHYPELNTKIIALKTKLTSYYEEIIQPKLFEYELIK